MTMLNFFK